MMIQRKILLTTIINGFALFVLGVQISQRGPALIDLQDISGTDIKGGSLYFTLSNLSYMIGSFIAGFLHKRVKATSVTIVVAIVLSAIATGVTPLCQNYASMLLILCSASSFSAIFETNVQTEQIRICAGESDAAMQFLSFCYSFGGIFGPLITEPFLAPKDSTDGSRSNSSTEWKNSSSGLLRDGLGFESNISNGNERQVFPSNMSGNLNASDIPLNSATKKAVESQILYAYIIVGLIVLITAVPFVVVSLQSCQKQRKEETEEDKSVASPRKLEMKVYLCFITLGCLYYFMYTAFDDSLVHFLPYFVVEQLDWSKEDGALLTSVYWTFSTVVKLALIPLSSRVSTGILLLASSIGMVVFAIGFTVACYLHLHILVWPLIALVALSSSAPFGGGMAWFDTNIMPVDGNTMSYLIISAAFGATTVPLPIGLLMDSWTSMAFAYIMVLLGANFLIVFLILLLAMKPYVLRKYGPPRSETEKEISAPLEKSLGLDHTRQLQSPLVEEERTEEDDGELQEWNGALSDRVDLDSRLMKSEGKEEEFTV